MCCVSYCSVFCGVKIQKHLTFFQLKQMMDKHWVTTIYGFINVNMGTIAAGFYVVFEVELSFSKYGEHIKDEKLMPYTLMDYYDYTRTRASKFIF